ncbi:MAG: methyltransferase domain-containing protein [Alphaproteobacteria bacterium]|nr:methyltransferase domain-containing protein [Alphaproteobacteria bacterium]
MTRNIYDQEDFFAGYSRLPRSVQGLDGAAEWPAMRALLPAMTGRRVLDLGCGFGWFARWARREGAASVLAIDVSAKMLARAAEMTNDPAITYARGDLEMLDVPAAAFDLAYSSLAFHYVANLEHTFPVIRRALTPGAPFVFSVEHPLYTAPSAPGFVTAVDGRRVWPLDRYLDEGERKTDWLATGVIKRHRTIGTYVRLLLGAGFTLTHLEEWGPTDAQIAQHPEWAVERDRPPFMLVAARSS